MKSVCPVFFVTIHSVSLCSPSPDFERSSSLEGKKMVFDNSPASPESLPDFVDQKPHFGASKWRVVQWRKTLILMTLPKKAVFFLQKNLQKPNQKVFFLHIVIANILIEKEVVYNRRERACPSGKSKTAPAWYTRDNRGIAKRKK